MIASMLGYMTGTRLRRIDYGYEIMQGWYCRKLISLLEWIYYTMPTCFSLMCVMILQLITNPDMLHVSILPFHGQFRRILSNLRYFLLVQLFYFMVCFQTIFSVLMLCICLSLKVVGFPFINMHFSLIFFFSY